MSSSFPTDRCVRNPGRRAVWALAIAALVFMAGTSATARERVLVGENSRMSFNHEIIRIAVGDPQVASVQMISSREILVLGRRAGQTNLILWHADGRVAERSLRVERDLSILRSALRAVHPAISVMSAPDQDAVVIRGVVPEAQFSRAAEAIATDYLRGGALSLRREGALILGDGFAESGDLESRDSTNSIDTQSNFLLETPDSGVGGRVINLIRVDDVPLPLEERLRTAVTTSGGGRVAVRRLMSGPLPDDLSDTFVLEGQVRTQVDLVRALLASARMIDERATADQIQVIADEGGSLSGRAGGGGGRGGGAGGGGGATLAGVGTTIGGLGGGGGNNLNANIARAKALSLANGRILSFIEVEELPHVRLEARIYEVNRSRLRGWDPNFNVLIGGTDDIELLPSIASGFVEDGGQGITAGDIQGALSLINGGTLLGGLQYVGDAFAIDVALGLLERASIARALAKPSISVLAGEVATFSAGGQIPIAVTVDTTTSATAGTLLSSTIFADFGVNLSVRPLVDEHDMITLDVSPSISQPDFDLTADLVGATGTGQPTTAFQTRSLQTTARLRDGASFVIGGLLQTSIGQASNFTPWFHRIPGLGWLGKSRDDQTDELDFIVIVTPSLTHEPNPRAALWAYPDTSEIVSGLMP
ncbi:MAG: pilus assembly protein N-terminal domain-containing protein [Myxococcota bacterium]